MSDNIVWGWLVVLYLWLAGMAGGAYMAAYLVHNLSGRQHRNLLRLGTYVGIPLFGLGMLLLTLDLGRMEWNWHLFASFRPSSVMWVGTYCLLICTVVSIGLALRELGELLGNKIANMVAVEQGITTLGFLFSLVVVGYTGVLFAQTVRPLWQATLLLPWVFFASAFTTGIGLLLVALHVIPTSESPKVLPLLHRLLALFIGIDLVILALEVMWHAIANVSVVIPILTGDLGLVFWGGLVVIGLVAPLVLEVRGQRAGELTTITLGLIAPGMVILGGLAMRYVIVFGGQV